MKNSKLIKAITLFGFFMLIASFLFYRSGRLEDMIGSPNGGITDNSVKSKRDSLTKLRLSSSKSAVLTPQEKKNNDSIEAAKKQQAKAGNRTLLPTSKSMVITQPAQTTKDTPKKINPLTGKPYPKNVANNGTKNDSLKAKTQ